MIEELIDEQGEHELTLRGVIHRLVIWPQRNIHPANADDFVLFMLPECATNGLNLSQEDVNALHEFLGRYVK